MRFTVVTIFPEMFESALAAGVLGRARQAGAIAVDFVNPREFTRDRHRTVDDTPYGGGPGMVMKVEPVVAAIEAAAPAGDAHRVLLSPAGAALTQRRVRGLAALSHIVLVCGRYEGVDQRVSELAIDEELSVGDYVLSGGEIGAMAVIDAVSRLVPGVLGEAASAVEESFSESLLEYPQYTRPAEFRGLGVPEVLASGNHERIRRWRRARALERTAARRPDLAAAHAFTAEDEELWARLWADAEARERRRAAGVYVALVHHPVYDRDRRVVTSAVTNLDIHDIARAAATYGLAGYHVVTPVAAQRDKVERIVGAWTERTVGTADNRLEALRLVHVAPSVGAVREAVAARAGRAPLEIATSARNISGKEVVGPAAMGRRLAAEPERPAVIWLGTGWGLADDVIAAADLVLAPVRGPSGFNHLSVRSAAAVMMDRLFGVGPDRT